MAKSVQIDQICSHLAGQTSTIANVVGDRVYFGEPMREQTGIYLVLNSISQIVDRVGKQALVEVRAVGNNENVKKKDLVSLINMVTDALITTDSKQVYDLGTFEVYKVVEGGDFRILVDDKNRNILFKDYIFYFLD